MSAVFGKITRRTLFGFFSLCCIASALFCMYAIVNPRWYGAETTREATGTDARVAGGYAISPWYACGRTNEIWECQEYIVSGLGQNGPSCAPRSEGAIKGGVYAIRVLVILTGVFMALAAITASAISAQGPSSARTWTIAIVAFTALGVLTNVGGIIAAAVFYKTVLMCSNGFCYLLQENDPSVDCKEKFFHGAYVFFIGLVFPVVALGVAIFLLVTAPTVVGVKPPATRLNGNTKDKNAAPGPYGDAHEMYPQDNNYSYSGGNNYREGDHYDHNNGQNNARNANNNEIANANTKNSYVVVNQHDDYQPQQEAEAAVTFQPPEGDWEWDPNSNMYWSESSYLFLNPNDGHFFDPNSNQWYNPETEEWYATQT